MDLLPPRHQEDRWAFNAADVPDDGDGPWNNEALLKAMEPLLGSACSNWSKNLAGIFGDQMAFRAMQRQQMKPIYDVLTQQGSLGALATTHETMAKACSSPLQRVATEISEGAAKMVRAQGVGPDYGATVAKMIGPSYQMPEIPTVADSWAKSVMRHWAANTDLGILSQMQAAASLNLFGQLGQFKVPTISDQLLRSITAQVRPDLSSLADVITRPRRSPENEDEDLALSPEIQAAAAELGITDARDFWKLVPYILYVLIVCLAAACVAGIWLNAGPLANKIAPTCGPLALGLGVAQFVYTVDRNKQKDKQEPSQPPV